MESTDLGLLAIRLLLGGVFIGHGLVKFTARFGGLGLERAAGVFEEIGYRPARPYVVVAGLTELAAGAGVALGLFTPLTTAALVGVMVNPIGSAKSGHGPWYFNGGWEYDLTLLTMAAALAFTGPGQTSVDDAAGLAMFGWWWGLGALAVGLVSGLAVLGLRADSARVDHRRSTGQEVVA